MEEKKTGEILRLMLFVILFVKNIAKFFIEGGDKSALF